MAIVVELFGGLTSIAFIAAGGRQMQILETVQSGWGWTGIEPAELMDENDFGNFIIKDVHGQYWRLCPEDCYCEVVAADQSAIEALTVDSEFLVDWQMSALVDQATQRLGPLAAGRKPVGLF